MLKLNLAISATIALIFVSTFGCEKYELSFSNQISFKNNSDKEVEKAEADVSGVTKVFKKFEGSREVRKMGISKPVDEEMTVRVYLSDLASEKKPKVITKKFPIKLAMEGREKIEITFENDDKIRVVKKPRRR